MVNNSLNHMYVILYTEIINVQIYYWQGYSVSLAGKFLLGLAAGTLATSSNMPFDVAKSRIQGPPPVNQPNKYKHTLRTIALVFHEEG